MCSCYYYRLLLETILLVELDKLCFEQNIDYCILNIGPLVFLLLVLFPGLALCVSSVSP